MSFQYLNPYNNQFQYPIQNGYQNNYVQNQTGQYPVYLQNPIQASFYNQGLVYPFNNPFYQPNLAQNFNSPDYQFMGTIPSPTGERTYLYQLQNGQKVAILPRKNSNTIVKTFLDAGSMNETDRIRGISHMEEHMLFKGSSKLKEGDVFKLTGLMGASTNASTDYAKTDYYISAPYFDKNDFQKVIEIQGDMISNPQNSPIALEREKGPVCSEISMCDDNIFSSALDKTIRNLFQIKSNSHDLVAGSIETVSNLTSDDMKKHHQTYYDPKDLYTVIVGDVNPAEAIELVNKNFTLKSNNLEKHYEQITPIRTSIREDIRSTKTNSTNVIMAFSGPRAVDSRDFVIAQMINTYLSACSTSEFKSKIEDMNAGYESALKKVSLKDDDPYALINVISLNPNDEQKGIDAFYDAVLNLQNNYISDDDLLVLKKYIEKSKLLNMDDCEELCDLLGVSMMDNSINLFSNFYNIADSITKEDIRNFARRYFDLNKVAMTIVHPASVSESEIQKNYNSSKYSFKNTVQNNAQIAFCGQTKLSTESIEQILMPNNTHLAIDKSKNDLCVYSWSVDTPPIKPKNPNIPAVLAYMFQKGSEYKNQNELERYKELNGIDTLVEVYGKSIDIHATCALEDSKKTLDLLYELLYHPKLTENDFNQAKQFVKETLLTSQKDANSNLYDKIYPGFFPNSAQMLKSIDSLTLNDVKEFYNELLKNAASSFAAALPLDKKPQLRDELINFHQNQPVKFKENVRKLSPIFTPNPAARVIYDTDDLNQAQIYKSYQFPLTGNIEDEAKYEILNTILGADANARLFSDLRSEQNLAYSVFSNVRQFEDTGVLTLGILTTTDDKKANVQSFDNVQKSLEGFKKHTDLLTKELITDEELKSAKTRLKQNITGEFQDTVSKNLLVLMNMQEPYGIKRIDKYIEAIDKITKEDILKTAQYIFSQNPTISILASPDTINSQMDYLKTQGELVSA